MDFHYDLAETKQNWYIPAQGEPLDGQFIFEDCFI